MIIIFNHSKPKGKLAKKISRITLAIIKDNNNIIAQGEARCSVKDVFNKEEGRIFALRRATRNLDKDLKREVWRRYVNRRTVSLKKSETSLVSSI